MKRRDVEKILRERGWWQVEGAKHDKWTNGIIATTVPRHSEINEFTAKGIIKIARASMVKK